ncbi:MAG: hypothetical protein WB580_03465, partial [Candidatus Binataceae bacterium]
ARKLFVTLATATALSLPAPCQAATAGLPWDQTLIALQAALIGTVAPAAIGLAFSGAVILYAVGGHDKDAGRLVGSGIGGCIALVFVHLLNYLLPDSIPKQLELRSFGGSHETRTHHQAASLRSGTRRADWRPQRQR